MSERTPIRVNEESLETLREIAKDRGIELPEAADLAIKTARSRLRALANYAAKAPPKEPKPKKEKKAKEPKPKKEKKARAKKGAAKKKAPLVKKGKAPKKAKKKASKSLRVRDLSKVAKKRSKKASAKRAEKITAPDGASGEA